MAAVAQKKNNGDGPPAHFSPRNVYSLYVFYLLSSQRNTLHYLPQHILTLYNDMPQKWLKITEHVEYNLFPPTGGSIA